MTQLRSRSCTFVAMVLTACSSREPDPPADWPAVTHAVVDAAATRKPAVEAAAIAVDGLAIEQPVVDAAIEPAGDAAAIAVDTTAVDPPVVDASAVDARADNKPGTTDAGVPASSKQPGPKQPAGRNTPAPGSDAAGSAEIKRGLEPEVVRKVVMANVTAIRNCYTRELAKRPDLDGKIGVTFVIGSTGDVIKTLSAVGDRVVGDCINALIARAKFPPPPGGGTVTINYPFVFTPSE